MKKFFVLLLFPLFLFSLERTAWLGNPYQFLFKSEYDYDYYKKFSHAIDPLKETRHDNTLKAGLNFTLPKDTIDAEAEIEFAKTKEQNFSFRSLVLQTRYQFLNDINGDYFISLNAGINFRYTTEKSLKDISCPYHNNLDIEVFSCLGKEISSGKSWLYRVYTVGYYGIENKSNMWGKIRISNGFSYKEIHSFYCDLIFEQTFGKHHFVNIDHFFGYGRTHSTYLDLDLAYEIKLDIWGKLKFDYIYRVISKCRPERVSFFGFLYTWNFSF